jgi:hypothetical protein
MRSLCLAAFLALAGCSFDAEKSDISVTVTNISQTQDVNHLDVTLTLPDGSTQVFHPTFGPQSTTTVDLSLSSGGQTGAFTLKVDEVPHNKTTVGTMTVIGTLPVTEIVKVQLPDAP